MVYKTIIAILDGLEEVDDIEDMGSRCENINECDQV